jgi:hypothetical protein
MAAKHQLPAIYSARFFAADGCSAGRSSETPEIACQLRVLSS